MIQFLLITVLNSATRLNVFQLETSGAGAEMQGFGVAVHLLRLTNV